MKKYTYTVKGLNSPEKAEDAARIVAAILPDATDIECNQESSTLSFSIKFNKTNQNDAEQRLLGALAVSGLELILPEGVNTYSYVGDKPKKVRTVPLAVAVSLIAAFMALTVLFTFASCGFYSVGINGGVFNPGTNNGSSSESTPEYISDLVKLDEIFRMYSYEGVDEEAMRAAILKAYVEATGDLYAEYMTAEEYKSYLDDNAGDFVGVGVSVVYTTININGFDYNVLQIISVFADSPALEAGVQVGDCVMYAGIGENKEMVQTLGYTEAISRIRGEAGTLAEFTVFRPDKNEASGYKEIEFSIERRAVTSQSVTYRVSETNSKVGIVSVTGFDMTTAPQFTEAVDSLKSLGCEYFVFDMRNNPGGALNAIQAVLSYFLDKGDLIVSTEYSDGSKNEYYVKEVKYSSEYSGYNVSKSDIGKYKDLNMIVLTNENTASAAGLFTATMRDYELAEIVGTKTYGKGCMQSILPLSRYGLDGALRVTSAMYFSKSHTVYHNIGIVPDHEIELSEEAKEYNFFLMPEHLDNQLQKAIEIITQK